ncbi:exonuclease SbcCD subunit D [Corallincola spongiicola]|uniref:Nuclease SbcCD subunit D n=1 Tax=Corallincola spongiicola TaxID=2520508 RepID=A0ABY1WSP9_9GAMM|nr:exonuclease SbcCD subunit D [Corallincola spongiicola]TAA47769.1 exonuclease SbcCD subunit D [Corallincola spongiicola]
MKFIHTSDWHLGRQFHNASLLEDQRHILQQIVDIAEREHVDAVIVAGDIYDRSVPPANAVALLDEVLDKLCHELQLPVLMISGNHDSAQRLRFAANQLRQSGLHIMGDLGLLTTPVLLHSATAGTVQFFGLPYCDPEQVRDAFNDEASAQLKTHDQAMAYLMAQLDAARDKQLPSVVIAHCFVAGGTGCESERPLSIGGAEQVSASHFSAFNYTALGHLHGPQKQGAEHIRYSGSPLKYSFSEQNQNKSISLVSIDEAGAAHVELIPLQPLRDMRIIEGELNVLIAQGKTDPHSDDYLMVRLTDTHAILDPMGKLRAVYPNVLHLEKRMLQARSDNEQALQREKLRQSELSMFRDFFQQVHGNELTGEQDQALQTVIKQLHQDEANR